MYPGARAACTAQVRTLSTGRELNMPSPDVIEGMAQSMSGAFPEMFAMMLWPAMLRKAERECPGFDG